MRERLDRLLTFRRARTYATVLVGLYVVAWCYVVVNGSPPLNIAGEPIGGDYVAFHSAGRLLLTGHGGQLYDRDAVSAVQHDLLLGRVDHFYDAFRNPPFAALPFVPLALLDLLPGLAIWTLLSLSCLGLALWLLLQDVPSLKPRWRGLLLLVLAFVPVYFGIIDGENATISLLLYVLIYRALLRSRDAWAGVWAALGLFKPQLFFLFPLVFIATRRWRALPTYGITACVLIAVSLLLVGPDGLRAWLRILVEPESSNATANAWRMASLKSFFDLALPSGRAALAPGLYLATSLLLLSGVVVVWTRNRLAPVLPWIFTSLVAVLVDPHLVDYDLSVLVPAGVLAATHLPALRGWIALLYPLLVVRAAIPVADASVQIAVPLLLGLAAYVWFETATTRENRRTTEPSAYAA